MSEGVGITPDGYRFCTDEWLVVVMEKLTPADLADIEARLDAFGEWYARIIDGAGYDPATAMEDYGMLERDMRQLIEQVRARG